jgi:hypothetical protein
MELEKRRKMAVAASFNAVFNLSSGTVENYETPQSQ